MDVEITVSFEPGLSPERGDAVLYVKGTNLTPQQMDTILAAVGPLAPWIGEVTA